MGSKFLWVDEAIEKVVDIFDAELSRSPGISIKSTARQSVLDVSITAGGEEFSTQVIFNRMCIEESRLVSACQQIVDKVKQVQHRNAITDVTWGEQKI